MENGGLKGEERLQHTYHIKPPKMRDIDKYLRRANIFKEHRSKVDSNVAVLFSPVSVFARLTLT